MGPTIRASSGLTCPVISFPGNSKSCRPWLSVICTPHGMASKNETGSTGLLIYIPNAPSPAGGLTRGVS